MSSFTYVKLQDVGMREIRMDLQLATNEFFLLTTVDLCFGNDFQCAYVARWFVPREKHFSKLANTERTTDFEVTRAQVWSRWLRQRISCFSLFNGLLQRLFELCLVLACTAGAGLLDANWAPGLQCAAKLRFGGSKLREVVRIAHNTMCATYR